MFGSFVEMATHLLQEGYKDAAAVIMGSVLEQHSRELAGRTGLEVENEGKFKKAETLNTELAKNNVYSKLDQKNVTAWLGSRNDAAHGNYGNYSNDQVRLMLDAVRDFMTRLPA